MSNPKVLSLETSKTNMTLERLENGSAFTVSGAGGNINDWAIGLKKMLKDKNIGHVDIFYTWTGKFMNETYKLSGKVAYPDNFVFIAFPIEGMDIGKLAIFKMEFGARWLDDIVDNNTRHMEEETC